MRRAILSLGFIALSVCALAQSPSSATREKNAVQHAKNLLASSFDSRLPRIPLEYFLDYETDGAPRTWTIAQCDEQSKHPDGESTSGAAVCVRAQYELKSGEYLTVLIKFEETQTGNVVGQQIVKLAVGQMTGHVRPLRNLGDLPMELHRRLESIPSKTPRDLPSPARDS